MHVHVSMHVYINAFLLKTPGIPREKKKKAAEEIIYGQLPNVNNKGVDYSNSLTLNAEINNVANPDCQRCLSVCQV